MAGIGDLMAHDEEPKPKPKSRPPSKSFMDPPRKDQETFPRVPFPRHWQSVQRPGESDIEAPEPYGRPGESNIAPSPTRLPESELNRFRLNQYPKDRLDAAEAAILKHENDSFTLADLGPWQTSKDTQSEEGPERGAFKLSDLDSSGVVDDWLTEQAAAEKGSANDRRMERVFNTLMELPLAPDEIDLEGEEEEEDAPEPPEWNHDEENISIYGGTPEDASERANEDLHRSLQNADSSSSDPDEDDPRRTIWHVTMPGGEEKIFLVGEDGETHNITNRPHATEERPQEEDTGGDWIPGGQGG